MYIKYPRTHHLPWSEGATNDDKVLKSVDHLLGQEVVITEKMDGECTSLYNDHTHARSIDSANHESRDWVKQFWGGIRHDIPKGYRVCGENATAEHSIAYSELPSYFLGFSMWYGEKCFSWDDTMEWFELIGIEPVPVLYRGVFDSDIVKALAENQVGNYSEQREGYVVRVPGAFYLKDFQTSLAKYVRKGHVQTDKHWMHQAIVYNKLK